MDNPRSLNVMVVDDIPHICKLLAEFIGYLDHVNVVGTATSIKEALDCVTNLEPHVVVLDISMPRFGLIQNGVDVLRWIKQHYPKTEVIMLTNHSEDIYRKTCQQLGAYAFLDKSMGSELLAAALDGLVIARTKASSEQS